MRKAMVLIGVLVAGGSGGVASAAPTPRGQAVAIACQGAQVAAGRKIVQDNKLRTGSTPDACFGRMQIYDGPNTELVAVAASASCPKGKALDVYGQSRAGGWYAFFEQPICGSTVSIGPKDPYGDWMLTIEGKHYDQRGAFYVPVTY